MNVLQSLIDGVAQGAVFALVAVGIALVFGVLRLVNFAYGELITIGGYALALTTTGRSRCRCWLPGRVGRAGGADRARRLPPAARRRARDDARGDVRGRVRARGGVAHRVRRGRPQRRRARRTEQDGDQAGRSTSAGSRSSSWSPGWRCSPRSACCSTARTSACRCARRRPTSARRARWASAPTGSSVRVRPRRPARRRGRDAADPSAPLVKPTFGLTMTIFALVGVVVGGMDRLASATLGGFALGFANSFVGAKLPAEQRCSCRRSCSCW